MDKKFIQNKFSDEQMSLVDLFTGPVIGSSSTTASLSEDAESTRFLKAYGEQENRFIPQVDFATASNFAKFGSATSYYEDAFTRIHNQYPYDGSHKEKVLWELSSSYLDKYIFENVYPRTNGFVTFNSGSNTYTSTAGGGSSNIFSSSSPQYIKFFGGPNADPFGNFKLEKLSGKSTNSISKANVYDTGNGKRQSNLQFNLDEGMTVEFWMKKNGWVGTTPKALEVLFSSVTSEVVPDDNYLYIYINEASPSNVELEVNTDNTRIFTLDSGLSNIADSKWHHYAITLKNLDSGLVSNLYVDGIKNSSQTLGSIQTTITSSMVAAIGAMSSDINGTVGPGWGNVVSSSFDEFRYWKTERSAKEIGRYYISDVNGGTNTDKANTDLGVYFKFNEGITQTASIDQTILDYSGRISNGTYINYNSTNGRSTSSAIVESGKSTVEFKDPIIYPFHPSVKSTLTELKIKGNEHDFNNSNSLINSIPSWIVENDQTEGTGELSKLIQISANYLDSLYLQIEALPTIKNINYASSSAKPHFFNDRLLKDYGFDVDEILTDVSLFAYSNTRDENKIFEKKLYDVKNQIYKNIYNNLVYIYKSKGTIKSFRNFLRCTGIDEELVRLNLYGLNTDWKAKTNSRNVASKVKYLDFFNNNNAVVYGYPETGNSNSHSFISGSGDITSGIDLLSAITLEADVIFPKYPANAGNYSKNFNSLNSSIMGMDGVKHTSDTDNLTWPDVNTNISSSLQVLAVRKEKQTSIDNPEVFFMVSGSMLSAPITSSVYTDVYDNSKWKLAVRFKHRSQKTGLDFVSSSIKNDTVSVEFFGTQMIADTVLNQFKVSGSLVEASKYGPFIEPKRIYCGARRTNFTGSVVSQSDVFVSNVRYWNSYISDEALLYHAKNDTSYGTDHPYQNTYLFEGKETTGLSATEMPEISSLALNWTLDQVTGSDGTGRFTVADFSSGSNNLSDYKLSNIVQRQHTGRGDFFQYNSSEVTEIKYNPSTRLVPFDQINSDDMVDVVDFEGEIFTRESRPQEYFFAFEKSMYANISDEMLNMFATIRDFHNIVGEPVNRYRKEYKEMEKIRQLFFRRVGNTPDIERFVDYYKWIDNSISTMLRNLIPASANFARNVRTMVESHVLERNKIETKFPTLELNQPEPIGQIKAINELTYDWKHGHHPASGEQQDGCLYWHDRAERNSTETTSGNSSIDSQRETIRVRKNTVVSGSSYVLRKLTRPYRFEAQRTEDFKIDNIKLNFAQTELNKSNSTQNIVLQNIENFKACNDNLALRSKRKVDFQANVNGSLLKGRAVAPFTIYSSSVSTGYKGELLTFGNQIEINNNHIDAYGTETQEPLQGPFSKIHVGGRSSRKVAPFTPERSRPEDYDLTVSSDSITLSQRSLADPQAPPYFLDEIAKRPVVIKNIKHTTASAYLGNYSKEYQIVQTVGANTQRGWLKNNFSLVTQNTPEVLNLSGNINFNNFNRDTNNQATAQLVLLSNNPAQHLSKKFTLVSANGISKTYTFFNGGVGPPATGDVVSDEIVIQLNGLSSEADFTAQVVAAVASSNGHNGAILTTRSTTTDSNDTVTFTQRDHGSDGNTPITLSSFIAIYQTMNGGPYNTFFSGGTTRNSLQSVTIADRFSGPGSPEAMSPGYLDPASHTFSVYNSINYRNMTVRLPRSNVTFTASNSTPATPYYQFRPFGGNPNQSLRTLQTDVPLRSRLRHPMSFEGFDTYLSAPNGSILTASIHRVNRNKKNSPIPFGVFVINHALHDNGFVQHAIPQSDRQYSWITASLKNSMAGPNINTSLFYGGGGDGTTAPLGYSVKSNDTTFISASSVSDVTSTTLFVDFANLNIMVNDPLNTSLNLISSSTGEYRQTNITTIPQVEVLNSLISHRQGPYGWPSWKQTRGDQHPIIRNHKLTNTFSTIDRRAKKPEAALVFNKQALPPELGGKIIYYGQLSPTKVTNDGFREIINLTESMVTVAYKPMIINTLMKGVNSFGVPLKALPPPAQKFKITYANESAYFAENKVLDHITVDSVEKLLQANRSRSRAYLASISLYSPNLATSVSPLNPLQNFVSLKYAQTVWPRTRNTFLKRTKMRNNYTEVAGTGSNGFDRIKHRTFWRDSLEDRKRTDQAALNSQGLVLSQSFKDGKKGGTTTASGSRNQGAIVGLSMWPLDGRYTGSAAALAFESLQAGAASRAMQAGLFQGTANFMLQQGKIYLNNRADNNISGITGELFSSGMYRSISLLDPGQASEIEVKNRFVTASVQYHGVDWNMGAYSGSQGVGIGNPLNNPVFFTPQQLQYTASSNIHWTTNVDAGKNPWFDSYEEYSADLRKIGKDYSIIPEFNISEYMEYYTAQNPLLVSQGLTPSDLNNPDNPFSFGSDFLKPLPKDKFIIQGINNSASVNGTFYKEYSHSDFLKNFDLVVEDHKKIANITNIKMTCRGLKKLLPYNGFYPVTRTLQMATLLSESLGSKIIGSGSGTDARNSPNVFPALPETQGLQALLQPLFAPGILYNTIKAGIAVDWPTYTGSMPITSIDTTGSLSATNQTRSYLSSSANYRLPFETIYNLDNIPISKHESKKEIYAVSNEKTDAHFSWDGNKNNNLYEKAMNNFLAESVNLFLHHSKLTSFISKKMSEVSFKQDNCYQMSVDLWKSAEFLMTEGASADTIASSDLWKSYHTLTQSYAWHGTSKRGVIYGPAVRFFDVKTSPLKHLSASGWPYCEQNDPAFAPYTPPYFYGVSTVDLEYKNDVDDTETPPLSKVLASITASYSNDLKNIPTGSYFTSSMTDLPWRSIVSSSSPAIQSMMHISSSLNLFGKTADALKEYDAAGKVIGFIDAEDPTDQERWIISTRYECPVLNFDHYADDTKARGMWNGYGKIPNYESEGIFIRLRDTNPDLTNAHGPGSGNTGSLLNLFFNKEAKIKPVGQIANDYEKSISECIVAIPYLPGKSNNNSKASEYNCIYSADDDKYFFPIDQMMIPDPDSPAGGGGDKPINLVPKISVLSTATSVVELQKKMKKFVFPPRYDWENNESPVLNPFVMFAFEFTHRFKRQELADIWQGVMPEISTKVVPETTTLNIPVKEGELLNKLLKNLSDKKTTAEHIKSTSNDLRWMVFKVKQRARNVYTNITEDLTDNIAATIGAVDLFIQNDDTYSYNWPYDFCSLVELGKIETELEIK